MRSRVVSGWRWFSSVDQLKVYDVTSHEERREETELR